MDGESPSISVAMTTFQGEKYLNEQLAAILEQTRLPDEIVIGDDASTDDTWSILRAFEEASPVPVRLLRDGSVLKEGVCLGADDDSALLVRTADGVERCLSGDLSIRPQ